MSLPASRTCWYACRHPSHLFSVCSPEELCRDKSKHVIAAIEYAIVNLGSTATLRASTPTLDFLPAPAWYDMDTETAHEASASRVLLRSESPVPEFVSNVVVQYLDLGPIDVLRLDTLDTTLDIAALQNATVLSHSTHRDGYLCVDDGNYTAEGRELRLRRSQLAYRGSEGNSMLSLFTGTVPIADWDRVISEITEMEDRWLRTTTTTSGGN